MNSSKTRDVPLALGLTSVVLGAIALMLFFMPILSIPLAAAGMIFGLAAFLTALVPAWTGLRWSIAGIVLCGLALAVAVPIVALPTIYAPSPAVPLDTQPVPSHYIPPPAAL
jgi:hypothetical protein